MDVHNNFGAIGSQPMVRVYFGSAPPPPSPDSTESLGRMTPKKRRPKCPATVIPVDDLYVALEYQANEQIIKG